MNLERSEFIDDGMPGVVSTIEPRHIIHLLGEIIHHFALTLVTPLRTDHCCYCHVVSSMLRWSSRTKSISRPTSLIPTFVFWLLASFDMPFDEHSGLLNQREYLFNSNTQIFLKRHHATSIVG